MGANMAASIVQFCMNMTTTIQFPSTSTSYTQNRLTFVNQHPFSSRFSVVTCARRRTTTSNSSLLSPKKKKQGLRRNTVGKEEDIEEDAFELLFKQLEEDLKNDGLSFDDDDDEITEEDLVKLECELEEALADDELLGLFDDTEDDQNEVEVKDDKKSRIKKGTTVNAVIEKEIEFNNVEEEEEKVIDVDVIAYDDEDEELEEDVDEDEDDRPLELKRWQLRRLAYALKDGRRKTNIWMLRWVIQRKHLKYDLCILEGAKLQIPTRALVAEAFAQSVINRGEYYVIGPS